MKTLKILFGGFMLLSMTSCGVGKLTTTAVSYQSIRTEQYKEKIPSHAQIGVGYQITPNGELIVVVKNLTNEIMVIDQTKSFFITPEGQSISYYDPTVRSTSQTSFGSTTDGVSVNLGSVAGFLGLAGPIGGLLGGINVGESNTIGSSTTSTTTFADQPQISLAPKSHGAMSKNFAISGVGRINYSQQKNESYTSTNSYCKFSVCISFSIDGGQTFNKLITPFYVNSLIVSLVTRHGNVNAALRNVLQSKKDAIHEQWWLLRSISNMKAEKDNVCEGSFIDWK